MTVTVNASDGSVLKRSQNLAVITRYAREQSPVTAIRVSYFQPLGNATVSVTFNDGAHSTVQFASWHVAGEWARKRRARNPNFYGARITYEP